MFGIGGLEFLVIAIAAILFISPKDLPNVLYTLGKYTRKIKNMVQSVSDGLNDFTKDAELDDIIAEANKAGDEMMDFRIEQQRALEARDEKTPTKKKSGKKIKSKKTKVKKND